VAAEKEREREREREGERERERERKTGRTGGHALWWVCALPSADSGESGPDTPIRSFLGVTRADDASVRCVRWKMNISE